MISLTDMEKEIINCMMKPNDNGEIVAEMKQGDYVSLTIHSNNYSMKQLRGSMGSLVKKGVIKIEYDEEEKEEFIYFTDKGYKLIKNLLKSIDR